MRKSATRNKVVKELEALQRQVDKLKKERIKNFRIKHDLGERVKELNCLYGISQLIEQNNLSLNQILQNIVELIPPSWQYPEITCARIIFEDKNFVTKNFKESQWKQSAVFYVSDEPKGAVEVFYLRQRPDFEEGPFLKEERHLIDGIARTIGKLIERKNAEEALYSKNAALKEIIAQIEMEKRSVADAVSANISSMIIPVLNKLKRKSSSVDLKYIEVLERSLEDLTSPFGMKVIDNKTRLTTREIEICNLIKNGMSMKEISKMLNISFFSVGTHRRNIRQKLGISNKKVNLPTFLKNYL